MLLIKLVDARKGLHEKCVKLFHNKKVAESIYNYLCDGIEECDEVELEQKKGEWILSEFQDEDEIRNDNYFYECSNCGHMDLHAKWQEVPYCWYCGLDMKGK